MRILPEQTVFTDSIRVAFDIPTQPGGDVEFRYTIEPLSADAADAPAGRDPTLDSPLYTGPFTLSATARVKVRPFRKGLKTAPWNIPGVDAGKTVWAVFRKVAPLPAASAEGLRPGLAYAYFEDDWLRLFAHAGAGNPDVLAPRASGTAGALLDAPQVAAMRRTDRAYAVRYDGYLDAPAAGLYSFHAPPHLYTTTMDAGYDLRVFVDGEEWLPNPDLHSENVWHVALAKGPHRFRVAFVDYRWKMFRDEYWMSWQEEQMWQGIPVLEISGPGIPRQPVPADWLRRREAP